MSDKPIAQQCGVPEDWSFQWVIDEFDSSFNTLAMASLRYHMDHAVTVCKGVRREEYQSMLDEFQELHDREVMTREHIEHYASHRKGLIEMLRIDCDECRRHYEEYSQARDKHEDDTMAARHKFVDLMPGLWS